MEIPLMEKVEIETIGYDEEYKEWHVYFNLKNDERHYRLAVYIDEIPRQKLSWWAPGNFIYRPKDKYLWNSVMEDKIWKDHLFEQAIYYIKNYSKEKIKLIQFINIDKKYHLLSFKVGNYPYDASIKVI